MWHWHNIGIVLSPINQNKYLYSVAAINWIDYSFVCCWRLLSPTPPSTSFESSASVEMMDCTERKMFCESRAFDANLKWILLSVCDLIRILPPMPHFLPPHDWIENLRNDFIIRKHSAKYILHLLLCHYEALKVQREAEKKYSQTIQMNLPHWTNRAIHVVLQT